MHVEKLRFYYPVDNMQKKGLEKSNGNLGLDIYTYGMCLPIFAAFNMICTADAVSIVESSRLHMSSYHQVKGTKRGFLWVLYVQIIAAKS